MQMKRSTSTFVQPFSSARTLPIDENKRTVRAWPNQARPQQLQSWHRPAHPLQFSVFSSPSSVASIDLNWPGRGKRSPEEKKNKKEEDDDDEQQRPKTMHVQYTM